MQVAVHLAHSAMGLMQRGRVVASGEVSVVATLSGCLALRMSDLVSGVGVQAEGAAVELPGA